MILVDTSIWIDHFSLRGQHMQSLLEADLILMHPWIIGELACVHLSSRASTIYFLQRLPAIPAVTSDEVLFMIEQHTLFGRGVSYVDMHLLASARLHGATLWSRDKRLVKAATDLQIAYIPPASASTLH